METFGQQLTKARKARQMTQGQLSEAMGVSRSTISHWENGHALPDIEAVRRLSTLLEHDFMAAEKKVEAPASERVLQSAPADATDRKHPRKGLLRSAALVALIVLTGVVLAVFGRFAQKVQYEPQSLAWYQQVVDNDAKHAYVMIEPEQNPTYAHKNDAFPEGEGWMFHFLIQEVNGVEFTVSSGCMTVFKGEVGETMEIDALIIDRVLDGDTVKPGHIYHWNGGFPLQDVTGVGIALRGHDSKGKEMAFRGYMELSKEVW